MPRLTLILAVLALLLAGCGGGPTTPDVELPRVGVEGGTIEGPNGFVVKVPPGATGDAEFGIDLRSSDPPPDDVLDEGESFVGPLYSVSASEAFEAQSDEPVIVSVPLPAGTTASSGGLQIAVRAPRESYTGEVEPFWHVMPAEIDETGTAIRLPLYGLPAEALEVAFVTSPVAVDGMVASQTSVQPLRSWSDDVSVVLKNARLFGSAAEQQRVRDLVRGFALEAVQGYRELGFDAPVWERNLSRSAYVLNVQHETKGICAETPPTLGTYLNLVAIMYVCYYAEHEDTTRFTVNHEVFHAFQNAYLDFAVRPGARSLWFIEGTAALAERSMASGDPIRTPDQYPDVGRGFAKDDDGEYGYPYTLQDLWAFLLRSSGLGFADLIAVMKDSKEVSVAGAHRVLSRTDAYADRFPTFEAAYWAFARNQAWERTQKLGDLGQPIADGGGGVIFDDRPPCSPIDPEGVWPFPLTYRLADEAFASGESSRALDLEPYSFIAVEIEVPDWATASSRTRLTLTLKSGGKTLDQSGGTRGTVYFGASCHGAERSVLTVHPWDLGSTQLVVLLANVDGANAKGFEILVEVNELEAPKATGVWTGTYRSDVYFDYGVYGLMCAEVVQTGETLSGTFYQRFDTGDEVFPITGTLESNNVTFGTLGANAITFSGWLVDDGTYMGGAYATGMDDAGEWAAVKTGASSCDTVAAPRFDFTGSVGTFHDARTGSIGAVFASVWDFQPMKPVYPVGVSFTGPATWNGGLPWVISHVPANGVGGPWWLWGSRAFELADGTFVAEAEIPHFTTGGGRSVAVDTSRVLPAADGIRANLSTSGDAVDFRWDPVPGAAGYQPSLIYYRNGEYYYRRYFATRETSHTLRVPQSTAENSYTYAVFVNAFSEYFGDYTLTGRQIDASRSITVPVEGAEPPFELNAAAWAADEHSSSVDAASDTPAD